MKPSPSDVHINQPLSQISLAYMQSPGLFIADQVFPVVYVEKQSDYYYEFDRADWRRSQMALRAPGTESAGSGFSISNTTYSCKVFGLHKDIPDQVRSNADSMLSLDAAAAEWLAEQAMIKREIDWAAAYFTTGKWGVDITGVAANPGVGQVLQWNDGNSTPIENMRVGMTAIQLATGKRPNTLVVGQQVWDQLVDHPDIVDRVKGAAGPGAPAIVTRQAVASILEIDRILVMGATKDTSNEGASSVNAFIGGKGALLCYVPPRPGLMTPAAGYTFAWRGYLGGTIPVEITRFRMQNLKSDRVEIEAAYAQALTGQYLGYFFTTIVA